MTGSGQKATSVSGGLGLLYPQQRTSATADAMSAWCQKATLRISHVELAYFATVAASLRA